jgi:acetyl esterase/lipase
MVETVNNENPSKAQERLDQISSSLNVQNLDEACSALRLKQQLLDLGWDSKSTSKTSSLGSLALLSSLGGSAKDFFSAHRFRWLLTQRHIDTLAFQPDSQPDAGTMPNQKDGSRGPFGMVYGNVHIVYPSSVQKWNFVRRYGSKPKEVLQNALCDNQYRIVFYLHGGAYFFGKLDGNWVCASVLSEYLNDGKTIVIMLHYPKINLSGDRQTLLSAQVDAVAGLFESSAKELICNIDRGTCRDIHLVGQSAGAGLWLKLLEKYPDIIQSIPGGRLASVALLNPWVDIPGSSDVALTVNRSFVSGSESIPIPSYGNVCAIMGELRRAHQIEYANRYNQQGKAMEWSSYKESFDPNSPILSPINGRFQWLQKNATARVFILAGERETLLDSALRLGLRMESFAVGNQIRVEVIANADHISVNSGGPGRFGQKRVLLGSRAGQLCLERVDNFQENCTRFTEPYGSKNGLGSY